MSNPADDVLVARCLEGDTEAFDTLLCRYQKPLYNGCLRIVGSRADAEDIVQNVFLKAYEKLASYDSRHKFFSWIYKMMVNESLNHVSRRKQVEPLDHNLSSPDKGPEAAMVESQVSAQIQDALMELEPARRAVIVLKYFGDLSYKELGFIFDVPEKTVKSRLYDARQALSTIMTRKGVRAHG